MWAVCAAPLLVVENTADDCIPPSHPAAVFAASAAGVKAHLKAQGANHLYAGQADLLAGTVAQTRRWLVDHGLADAPKEGRA